jgi:hypothetical protein
MTGVRENRRAAGPGERSGSCASPPTHELPDVITWIVIRRADGGRSRSAWDATCSAGCSRNGPRRRARPSELLHSVRRHPDTRSLFPSTSDWNVPLALAAELPDGHRTVGSPDGYRGRVPPAYAGAQPDRTVRKHRATTQPAIVLLRPRPGKRRSASRLLVKGRGLRQHVRTSGCFTPAQGGRCDEGVLSWRRSKKAGPSASPPVTVAESGLGGTFERAAAGRAQASASHRPPGQPNPEP